MPKKHCNIDPIPTWVVDSCLDSLAPFITQIINCSLKTASIPLSFKTALVRPLLKKPTLDPSEMKNYRPVSNLGFISKVLEKVVLQQINNHLHTHNLVEPMQSAYRRGSSTETALLRVHSDILNHIDNRRVVLMVLLDLSAAFDTVDHRVLISRLNSEFGFGGTVLHWIENYLTNREQRVTISDQVSTPKQLNCGVPQGSILGPVLYTLYTSSLGTILRQHKVNYHFYADDTQLYASCLPSEFLECKHSLERCIHEVYQWMFCNKLKMNSSKTEFIVFGNKTNLASVGNVNIRVGGSDISNTLVVRNLGVMLDDEMLMKHQVTNICRNSMGALRQIGKIRDVLDDKSVQTLVCQLVTSRLDYCNSLLAGIPAVQTNRLQYVQNTAARIVSRCSRRDHISPVIRSLHWLPISERVKFKTLTLTYKALRQGPPYLSELVTRYVPGRSLRSQSDNLLVEPSTSLKAYGDRAFTKYSVRLWNKLPSSLREDTLSFQSFKRNVKTFLFNQ